MIEAISKIYRISPIRWSIKLGIMLMGVKIVGDYYFYWTLTLGIKNTIPRHVTIKLIRLNFGYTSILIILQWWAHILGMILWSILKIKGRYLNWSKECLRYLSREWCLFKECIKISRRERILMILITIWGMQSWRE
jgi:hypothetical protein